MTVSDYYNKAYKDKQLKADLRRIDRLRFLFDEVPTGKRIVNIGCGPGVDIDFLSKTDNEVHGVDISDEALGMAEERGIIPCKFDLSGSAQLPFEDASFDFIIATDIFEHLFEPLNILAECKRLLKQDGVLIASVPNHFFWEMRLRILKGGDVIIPFHPGSKQWDYFHIRFFTSEGFEEFLEIGDFKITDKYYDNFVVMPKRFPRFLNNYLKKRYPDIFSLHFIVKAIKT